VNSVNAARDGTLTEAPSPLKILSTSSEAGGGALCLI
jgi:hypothetical protein